MPGPRRRQRREGGSAVVDFVLVVVVLVPLVLGVLQVSLVLLVRNTLTAAASDGARYAATVGRSATRSPARSLRASPRTSTPRSSASTVRPRSS